MHTISGGIGEGRELPHLPGLPVAEVITEAALTEAVVEAGVVEEGPVLLLGLVRANS